MFLGEGALVDGPLDPLLKRLFLGLILELGLVLALWRVLVLGAGGGADPVAPPPLRLPPLDLHETPFAPKNTQNS